MVNKGGKVERDNYEFGISRYKFCVCVCTCACACTWVVQSDPMDYSLPGSSVHRIFQARILEWGGIIMSLGLAHTNCVCVRTRVCVHARVCVHVHASCSVASHSLTHSVHRIFQVRILEWVAISSSRGSLWPRDQTASLALPERFFTTVPPGKL